MTENEKIHTILKYISENYKHGIIDTDELANELELTISEVNSLARKIIQNGDAKDGGSDKTNSENGTISILQTVATTDAFKTKKYLKMPEQKSSGYNITATNVQVGDNYGNIDQSSNESKIDGNDNTIIQGNKRSKIDIGQTKNKSKVNNYPLIGIIISIIAIFVTLIIGWDEFLIFFR